MRRGFAFWYERDWTPQRAAERIAGLDAAGLRLAHPGTGLATFTHEDDWDVDQVEIGRAELFERAAVEDRAPFTFQSWIGAARRVDCSIDRFLPDLVNLWFDLDGLTDEQVRFVAGVVFDQIRAAPDTTLGLVVDPRCRSGQTDWDLLVTDEPVQATERPGAAILPADVAARHPELHAGIPRRVGDLVIIDPDGLLPPG